MGFLNAIISLLLVRWRLIFQMFRVRKQRYCG